MIDGLNVLNTAPITGDLFFIIIGVFILTIGLITPLLCICISYISYNTSHLIWLSVLAVTIGCISIIYGCQKEVGTKYEVVIENNSGYETIMKNYDILEQRGDIWVIKEKSNE